MGIGSRSSSDLLSPLRSYPLSLQIAKTLTVVCKTRAASLTVKRAANGGFATKSPPRQNQQQHQGDAGAKQRPQTLDLLFANMKEQRMKVLSRKNNAIQYNGGGRRPRVPWARGHF
ncbi:RIBOSOME MATURATION FACTOR [Salix purpurea]|uniref:RIBOSOME MATURATION FACTOR n=1 Tax=Salix purpurea TaxID=77065 RepID=A0A9Q0TJG1_SALPP|nr:RIBOSOME MATURATION FACTOR [Salix purpurea]